MKVRIEFWNGRNRRMEIREYVCVDIVEVDSVDRRNKSKVNKVVVNGKEVLV